jgi:hypothetical protein
MTYHSVKETYTLTYLRLLKDLPYARFVGESEERATGKGPDGVVSRDLVAAAQQAREDTDAV